MTLPETPYANEEYPWLAAYYSHLLAFAIGMIVGVALL